MQRRKRMAMPALLRREKGAHLVSPGRRSRVERRSRARLKRGIFKPQYFASVTETALRSYAAIGFRRPGPRFMCFSCARGLGPPHRDGGPFFATSAPRQCARNTPGHTRMPAILRAGNKKPVNGCCADGAKVG